VAVEAFLARRIGFLDIARNAADTLEAAHGRGLLIAADTLDDVLAADTEGRRLAQSMLGRYV
jgi:1-deoxy-D-xylulose-5-phosphate reductoisomerase